MIDFFAIPSKERKKITPGAEIFSLAPLQFLMHRPFEPCFQKEFQIKSLILSKPNKKKHTHIKFTLPSRHESQKVLITAWWSTAICKCLIWAIGLECHNGFLNVYFPCVRDKILQFSWHLSKRRDILLALENLSFSQKITKILWHIL